jgi:hypothetical protein
VSNTRCEHEDDPLFLHFIGALIYFVVRKSPRRSDTQAWEECLRRAERCQGMQDVALDLRQRLEQAEKDPLGDARRFPTMGRKREP